MPKETSALEQAVLAHKHTEGPYAIVLKNIVKFAKPVAWPGAQGLWTPPPELLRQLGL